MLRRRFDNWGRTAHCRPAARARPRTEGDVVELVRSARRRRRRVKVVGAAHSWSSIAMTDGVLVSLDRLSRVLEVDREGGTVTVEAGMRLKDLNASLDRLGLALPILGSISEQSVGGVIATGTHGSSLEWGNLATFVRRIRLITASGDALELGDGDPLLDAVRVGLGALGVVTRVTLEIGPAFNLCEVAEPLEWDDALSRFDELVRSAEYAKLWWLPHTDTVQVFRYHRTHEAPNIDARRAWSDENVLSGVVFPAFLWLGGRRPETIAATNRRLARGLFQESRIVDRSDRSFNVYMPPRHRETEAAFAVEHSPEALARTRELIDSEGLRVNFITEVRVVRKDENWMSPAFGRDTCQLGAYIGHGADADRYFRRFHEEMRRFDARPHWGKETDIEAGDVLRLWPKASAFRDLMIHLDPEGRFSNPFLERVLGAHR